MLCVFIICVIYAIDMYVTLVINLCVVCVITRVKYALDICVIYVIIIFI